MKLFQQRLWGVLFGAIFLGAMPGRLAAQTLPSATLTGRVAQEGLPLPGVTVTARSSNLQGAKATTTSVNGDFIFNNLPPGDYTITFELSSFQTVTRSLRLASSQQAQLDTQMSLSGVSTDTIVIGKAEAISQSTQSSTTFTKELLDKLPVTRNLLDAVNITPGTNANGPGAAITISGGQSFENLFTVNGVVITDNIRGTPNNLFIEDAIQETTTSTSTISAEYGRFTGGVVNAITRSGGNAFSGSFRTTFNNDAWSAVSPAGESRTQSVVPRYEATLGGPIWTDHVWFFGAGRLVDTTGSGQTAFTAISYPTESDEKRYEGKLTLTPFQNHTVAASYIGIKQDIKGDNQGYQVLDLESLTDRSLPQTLLSLNYNGVLSGNLFVDAQYSKRQFTFEGSGSKFTDLIKGTNLRDLSKGGFSGAVYNSAPFCGVCTPENRDNEDLGLKGTYFLSTPKLGSHNITFGYDHYTGKVLSNNYQSGSNYTLFTTSSIFSGGVVYPVVESDSTLVYWPIAQQSQGSRLLTHSVFVNDGWKFNDRLSFNVGLRWDKNDATDQGGVTRASDSALSPRLAAIYDVGGNGKLRVSASYAKYVAAIQENQVSSATAAGTPAILYWYYDGPGATPINSDPGAPLLTSAQAITQFFSWFNGMGCPNLATCQIPLGGAQIPGLNSQIRGSLKSPNAQEYVLGLGGVLGTRGSYRVDGVYRKYGDFYSEIRTVSNGSAVDEFGNHYDIGLIQNSDTLERIYTGLHTQLAYRVTDRLNVGANWTWSHAVGNFDGENRDSGPISGSNQFYPEYFDAKWSNPRGDLAIDQRHKVRLYATYDVPLPTAMGSLSVSALHQYDSGTPYGAAGQVDTNPYVDNPGYYQPPPSVTYYFTPRDAFHTDNIQRTDLALTYSYRIGGLVELFVQPQVLNVFNNQGVVAVDTNVRTAYNAARFLPFNPFTQNPVQGPRPAPGGVASTNWDYGPSFGKARSVADYQLPRFVRLSVGVRF